MIVKTLAKVRCELKFLVSTKYERQRSSDEDPRHHQAYQLLSQLSSVINFTLPRRRPVIKTLYSGIKIFKYFQISRQNMMERVEYLRKPIQSQVVSPAHRRCLLIFQPFLPRFYMLPKPFWKCPYKMPIAFHFTKLFSIIYFLLHFTFSQLQFLAIHQAPN